MMIRDGKMHHLHVRPGEVGKYVLLPGDPGRCSRIAQYFDTPRLIAQNREYTTYTGYLDGEPVSVTSTGIGGPSTAIAVEELAGLGAHTLIRVGTSGGMQKHCLPGDLVIAEGAVRDEGTSRQYMPLAYPAAADLELTVALRDAARALEVRHHVGLVQTKDSFYAQQATHPIPVDNELTSRRRAFVQGGVLCSEMEAATLFVVARILKCRAGGIILVASNRELDITPAERAKVTQEDLLRTAVQGLRLVIRRDREKGSVPIG
jgi:uridine phosphorylase